MDSYQPKNALFFEVPLYIPNASDQFVLAAVLHAAKKTNWQLLLGTLVYLRYDPPPLYLYL